MKTRCRQRVFIRHLQDLSIIPEDPNVTVIVFDPNLNHLIAKTQTVVLYRCDDGTLP